MSSSAEQGRGGGWYAAALAVLGVVLAVGAVFAFAGFAGARPQPPPQPAVGASAPPTTPSAPIPAGPSPATGTPSSAATAQSGRTAPAPAPVVGPVLDRSAPVRLDIDSLGVHASLMTLGLNSDGTVQVPPLTPGSPPGWYRGSPTPGQVGPAVVLGHVDDNSGPAVFYRLGALKPGAMVSITRADHRVAVFRVDRVSSYLKDQFPTLEVYGNTDRATLRLITCGGIFNSAIGHYDHNIVAYATLVSSRPS